MIAFDPTAPHVRAYQRWQNMVRAAHESIGAQDFYCLAATLFQRDYVCELALQMAKEEKA